MPTSSSPSPADLAEDLQAYLPPLHGLAWVDRDDAALGASAWPDPTFSWWLGPGTLPTDLCEPLRADGAEPHVELLRGRA